MPKAIKTIQDTNFLSMSIKFIIFSLNMNNHEVIDRLKENLFILLSIIKLTIDIKELFYTYMIISSSSG